MGKPLHTVSTLPAARRPDCPFDPPAELLEARRQGPLSSYTFPGGHVGWLVTGFDLIKSVLSDPRFSSRREFMRHPTVDYGGLTLPPVPPGEFLLMDDPHHSRYRKPLMGKFTVRRMRLLTERVEEITVAHLDAMEESGPPTDLVSAFAKPVPAMVICELLGVPDGERASFQAQFETFMNPEAQDGEVAAAYTATRQRLGDLVAAKRAHPTDDVLSELTDSDLTDEELRGMALVLLAAGLDTTANMLALGTYALLRHPQQLAALRDDPGLTDRAVEELLRYLSVGKTFMRTALEDVRLGGRTIDAGASLILSYNTANRDPERFTDPHVLDFRRRDGGHVAFGHGVHQCLGQQLARVEMRVGFAALVNRFPSLRLAVPASEIVLRTELSDIHGVKSLPVTWDV
ncbi:cytochrome P450 [Streptomyces tendae]|uniref:cytochrome P450 n=1 Tax=Streptomyces tendae TaxID=1932 RepID=UPI003723B7BB